MDARKNSRLELSLRRQQVIDLHESGIPIMQIVKETKLSWPAVNNALKVQTNLTPAVRGRKKGTGKLINIEEEVELLNIIYQRKPWQVGLKGFWWNRKLIAQLINKKFGLTLSDRGLGNYLRSWNMVIDGADKSPYQRCTKPIRKWLDENYALIEQRAKSENAKLYWVSRAKIGSEHEMVCFVNNQGKVNWLIIKKYKSAKLIDILQRIIDKSRERIFLIRNNSTICNNEPFRDWLKKNKEKIECFPQ